MIRFFFFCIAFVLAYVGIQSLGVYDSQLEFTVFEYEIETTLFTFGAFLLLSFLVLLIFLKFVFFVFDIPSLIRNRMKRSQLEKNNVRALRAFSDLIMGKKKEALKTIGKVMVNVEDQGEIAALINAESEENFDKKITILRELANKKHFSKYASSQLAEIFFKNSHYKEAEEFAIKAFNQDDSNVEVIVLLIRIYAKMALWDKLVFVVSKLQRTNSKRLDELREELAKYYYMAAKNSMASDQMSEAVQFLESCLELKVDYIDALTVYTEIKTSQKSSPEAIKVLKEAYTVRPCFEIAQLLILTMRTSPEGMYGTLSGLVDPRDYNSLYLSIAAYLGLQDKIVELKDPKLITYES